MELDNIIEYEGINTNYSSYISSFREQLIEEIICVDNGYPLECITKVHIKAEPHIEEIIETPRGKNLSGLKLVGNQIKIKLTLNGRVEYLSNDSNMYFYKFTVVTLSHIAVSGDFPNIHKFMPQSYIQHISIRKMNTDSFYLSLLVLNTVKDIG